MPTGIELQRKVSGGGVADSDAKKREITWIASSEKVDRYGDIIRVAAWRKASLDLFSRQGKILLNHNYWTMPVARAVDARVDNARKTLLVTGRFPTEGKYADSDEAFRRATDPPEERTLDEASVGFLSHRRPTNPEDQKTREELGLGPYGVMFEEADSLELLELSMVTVPANTDATVQNALFSRFVGSPSDGSLLEAAAKALRDCAASLDQVLKGLHDSAKARLTSPEDRQAFVQDLVAALEQRGLGRAGPAGAGVKPSAEREGSYGHEVERQVKATRAAAIERAVGSAFRAR